MRFSSKHTGLVVCAFFLCLFGTLAHADTTTDLQSQIDDRTQKISQLESDIAALGHQLDQTSAQKQTLQSAVTILDLSNKKLTAQISLTQTQISQTDLQIQKLSGSIATTSSQMTVESRGVAATLRGLLQNDQDSLAVTLLGGGSLADVFDEAASLTATRDALRTQIEALSSLKASLQNTKTVAQQKRAQLSTLKASLGQQQQALAATIADKKQLLAQTKDQESTYQKLIAQKKSEEASFEQDLANFESQLKGVVDVSSLPHTGSGVLTWPLDSIKITQYFGNTPFATQNPQIYNGHGHSGVDFRASPGTPVKSAGDGIVMGTGNTDLTCPGASYGKWVFIKHNNGLSTIYGHLSVIIAAKGEQVNTGDVIGYSGSTGYATGPHLHFGVFASDVAQVSSFPSQGCPGRTYTMPVAPLSGYLNPLSYL